MSVINIYKSYEPLETMKEGVKEELKISMNYLTGGAYEAYFTVVRRSGYWETYEPFDSRNFRVLIHKCGRRSAKQDKIAIELLESYIERNNLREVQ